MPLPPAKVPSAAAMPAPFISTLGSPRAIISSGSGVLPASLQHSKITPPRRGFCLSLCRKSFPHLRRGKAPAEDMSGGRGEDRDAGAGAYDPRPVIAAALKAAGLLGDHKTTGRPGCARSPQSHHSHTALGGVS